MNVFISYASEDYVNAKRLYAQLSVMGVTPWMDKYDLLPGQEWKAEITRQINNSDVLIVLLSKTMISKRGFVQNELRTALETAKEIPEGRIFIIPVRIDKCDIPASLTKYHYIDLFERAGIVKLIDTINQNKNLITEASVNSYLHIQSEIILDIMRAIFNSAVNWNALSINDFIENFFPIARLMLLSLLMEEEDEHSSELAKQALKITGPEEFLSLFQKLFLLKKKLRADQEKMLNQAIAKIRIEVEKRKKSVEGKKFDSNKFVTSVVRDFYEKSYPLTTYDFLNIYHIKELLALNPDIYCNQEISIHIKKHLASLTKGDTLLIIFFEGTGKNYIKINIESKTFSIKGGSIYFSLIETDSKMNQVLLLHVLSITHYRDDAIVSYIDFQRELPLMEY